ncbi:MAG: M24 family metallopeptidase [Clostridiales Family XIII bacterium]|nr:M24 family metallopeptidase [Clostridiales Family XIII bacterium]
MDAFRKWIRDAGVDAFVVADADPVGSEIPAAHWRTRTWLSGFDGSYGTLVVTGNAVLLWTDGRYWLQAERQLAAAGAGGVLMREGTEGVPQVADWLCETLPAGSVIGMDGRVTMVSAWRALSEKAERAGLTVRIDLDPFAALWTEADGRPPVPRDTGLALDLDFAGESAESKRARVVEEIRRAGADDALICSADARAWLTNTRGGAPSDISFGKKGRLLYDPKVTNAALFAALPKDVVPVEGEEPVQRLKAVKNDTELANLRRAMERDGRVMVRFLMWIERAPFDGGDAHGPITEADVADKLTALRAADPCGAGDSFAPICAYGPNGASPHYHAAHGADAALENRGLLVVDSGGQYYGRDPESGLPVCGTTDITRTIPLAGGASPAPTGSGRQACPARSRRDAAPTSVPCRGGILPPDAAEERRDYTLVLKAHIAFATLRFRYGATGAHIDAVARKPLWDEGLDYAHGTGHGVGYFLNVHETPPGISSSARAGSGAQVRIEPDMVFSNEPGLYREGKHGIRIENLVRPYIDEENAFGKFLRLETLTLCPISVAAVDPALLDEKEKAWLTAYHKEVYERLAPGLTPDEKEWLRVATQPLV